METDLPSIKIILIVLVVLAKGGSELMKWFRKKQEENRQVEGMMKIPGNQEPEPVSNPEVEINRSWDPFGELPEPVVILPPPRVADPKPLQPIKLVAPMEAISPPPPLAAVFEAPPQARMHKVITAHTSRNSNPSKSRLPGGGSLRSMVLAKVVLDRPLSALGQSSRPGRG